MQPAFDMTLAIPVQLDAGRLDLGLAVMPDNPLGERLDRPSDPIDRYVTLGPVAGGPMNRTSQQSGIRA